MKIEINSARTESTFAALADGQVFAYDDSYFMKTDESDEGGHIVVSLDAGTLYRFSPSTSVRLVEAKVVIL